MDYARRNQQIANSFYNLGLEKSRIRDLSGAAQCLKKSLHFNKYQTDARNLLGTARLQRAAAAYEYDLSLSALLAAAGSDQTLNDYLQRDDRISAP